MDDETPVTNRQFKEFVNATNYITTAEKTPTLEEIPLLPPGSTPTEEALIPASLLFKALNNPVRFLIHLHGGNGNRELDATRRPGVT